MEKNILSVVNIHKEFIADAATVQVLRGINATFHSGCSYAITGISGSGKSTLLHMLAGFEMPSKGYVFFNNKPIELFDAHTKEQYLQRSIGVLFQKPYLIKELSVIENIMLPGIVAGVSRAEALIRAQALLTVIKLTAYADAKPGVLSGGQQQRVCLARALHNKPTFLLADEPTAGLDAGNRTTIIELMQYGVQTWGMGLIVSTHDTVVADAMKTRFSLRDGLLHLTQ